MSTVRKTRVQTTQTAPSIFQLLGVNPKALQTVSDRTHAGVAQTVRTPECQAGPRMLLSAARFGCLPAQAEYTVLVGVSDGS